MLHGHTRPAGRPPEGNTIMLMSPEKSIVIAAVRSIMSQAFSASMTGKVPFPHHRPLSSPIFPFLPE
jgi:hypothetical protein